jgi:hypothetical protein
MHFFIISTISTYIILHASGNPLKYNDQKSLHVSDSIPSRLHHPTPSASGGLRHTRRP